MTAKKTKPSASTKVRGWLSSEDEATCLFNPQSQKYYKSEDGGLGFIWPSGFRHYVEKHNVKPTAAFIVAILGAQE